MAIRISEMTNRGVVEGSDLFEICHIATVAGDNDSKKTFSVSAEAIANYCKTLNNGGFNGITNKALDEFGYKDAGVYFWSGEAPLVGMPTSGMLEVLSYVKPSTTINSDLPTITQRLTSGDEIYCRTWTQTVGWSNWSVLKNANGNIILSGVSSEASVNFNTVAGVRNGHFFSKPPVVTVSPINNSADKVCIINVQTVNQDTFSVARFSSDISAVVTTGTSTTSNTYTQVGNEKESVVTSSEKTTTVDTRGAWKNDAKFSYYWIATVDG